MFKQDGRLRARFKPEELRSGKAMAAAIEIVRVAKRVPRDKVTYYAVTKWFPEAQWFFIRRARRIGGGVTHSQAFYDFTGMRRSRRSGTEKLSNENSFRRELLRAHEQHLTRQRFLALSGLAKPHSQLLFEDLERWPMLFQEAKKRGAFGVARIVDQRPVKLHKQGALKHWPNARELMLKEILAADGWPSGFYSPRLEDAVRNHHGGFRQAFKRMKTEPPALREVPLYARIIAKNFGAALSRVRVTREDGTQTISFAGSASKLDVRRIRRRIGRLKTRILPAAWSVRVKAKTENPKTLRCRVKCEVGLSAAFAKATGASKTINPKPKSVKTAVPKASVLINDAKTAAPGKKRRPQPQKPKDPLAEVYEKTLNEKKALIEEKPEAAETLSNQPLDENETLALFARYNVNSLEFRRRLAARGIRIDDPLVRMKMRMIAETRLPKRGSKEMVRQTITLLRKKPENSEYEYSAPQFYRLLEEYANSTQTGVPAKNSRKTWDEYILGDLLEILYDKHGVLIEINGDPARTQVRYLGPRAYGVRTVANETSVATALAIVKAIQARSAGRTSQNIAATLESARRQMTEDLKTGITHTNDAERFASLRKAYGFR
jgi:hypothetical protein